MKNNEIWKDILGYEGLYQVSNLGRVKSLKYGKEKILKPRKNTKGYLSIKLYKNGLKKTYYVHRLTAQTFIPNPNDLTEINHKDEDKENNRVENLEWCDRKYNNNYGTRTVKCSKLVLQFTKTGEFVNEWKSTMDVERNLGYDHSKISACCNGKRKSAYNFIWKYHFQV